LTFEKITAKACCMFLSAQDHADKRVTTGILQLCFAMLLVPVLDVFAKLLGRELDPIQVTFMRFVMQILLLTPFVLWGRLWIIPKGTLAMQFARGILLAIATACFFAALQHLPMAEAITIYFVQPLLLTAISALFLGEVIRLRRVMAIVIGLVGVVVILQPSLMMFGWPALLPLVTALTMACYVALTRRLAGSVHPYQMQMNVGISATITLGAALLVGGTFDLPWTSFHWPTTQQLVWVAYMGIAATIGHIFIVWAAGNAPASVLAPFQYLEIVTATILGYLVFHDLPAQSTIWGSLIIIGSGIYLFHRERLASRAKPPVAR
jgi:S-adenosylmethionine uptake transporter